MTVQDRIRGIAYKMKYPYRLWWWEDCPVGIIQSSPPKGTEAANVCLRASLKDEGMINPVLCAYAMKNNPNFRVILGVRRFNFWKELGHTRIAVLLVSYDMEKEFPCEELEQTAEAVGAKFASGWARIKVTKRGLKMFMKESEFS